jgi:hypothetical protein
MTGLKQALQRLRDAIHPPRREMPFDWFTAAEVQACLDAPGAEPDAQRIDAQTCQDLNLPDYARALLQHHSIFARQYFEQRFRCGAPADEAARFMNGAEALANHPAARAHLSHTLQPLRLIQHEVASLLFGAQPSLLPSAFQRLQQADKAGLLACALAIAWPAWPAWVLLTLYVVFSLRTQVRHYRDLKRWTDRRDALRAMLGVAGALTQASGRLPAELRSPHQPAAADVARLAALLRPGLLARSPATAEYANFLFLYEYARASRASAVVAANRSTLQSVFQHVARLELQLAVAQAMTAGGVWCRPALSTTRAWAFQGLVHPLIAQPQALSVQAGEQSLFISGQNGRGKSTLLRAVGLGLATFRAFGFAHAQAATLPHVAVWSSLQMDDSIAQGRSLYMSELDRAAVMLSVARQGTPVVFLVDELFRGTNHVESVAASAATLQALGASACVLATSHNLVLAALLKPGFDAVRVVLGDGGQLRIEPGVLADTNGIGLMSTHGIAAPLAARAQAIGDWYAGCVAHPDALPPALLQ